MRSVRSSCTSADAIRLLAAFGFAAGCGKQQASGPPSPAVAAADTARARTIAALFNEPPNDSLRFTRTPIPTSARAGSSSGGVIVAFAVDDGPFIVPSTITILEIVGAPAFAKSVCETLPQFQFGASPRFKRPSLVVMPFWYGPLGGMTDDIPQAVAPLRHRLEDMPTSEREVWLLGKGCDRYK